jgi:hypothetical protein
MTVKLVSLTFQGCRDAQSSSDSHPDTSAASHIGGRPIVHVTNAIFETTYSSYCVLQSLLNVVATYRMDESA